MPTKINYNLNGPEKATRTLKVLRHRAPNAARYYLRSISG